MKSMVSTFRRPPFWLGLAIAVGMHLKNGWWLDASSSVWQMVYVLSAVGFTLSIASKDRTRLDRAIEMWVGFLLASTTILMAVLGGGNLFPIVIGVGATMSAAAVVTGFAAAVVTGAVAA